MKVVLTGKGGAGKTTVAGTLCRLLSRSGQRVVAVDCDPSPNLGVTLGLDYDVVEQMPAVLNGLIASGLSHADPRPDRDDRLRRFGLDAPDGVRLVATGRIEPATENCLCCGSHQSTRAFFAGLSSQGRIVVADLEAGMNDLLWTKPAPEDVVVAVAEPSAKSVEIARRAVDIAQALGVQRVLAVANRVTDEDQRRHVEQTLGVPTVAVPADPVVQRADQLGRSPLDLDPGAPAVRAVHGLVDRLLSPV
jgi:CO dehydrogenase maturation factor